MARRIRFTGRTMGERSVRLTLTMSVKDQRKITDRAWEELQDVIDQFIEDIDSKTIFTSPVIQETTYSRQVEVRETLEFS